MTKEELRRQRSNSIGVYDAQSKLNEELGKRECIIPGFFQGILVFADLPHLYRIRYQMDHLPRSMRLLIPQMILCHQSFADDGGL